jgi:hypothetical protein
MKEKRVQFEYKNKLLFKSKFRKIKPITMISSRDIRKNMIPPSETRTIVRERGNPISTLITFPTNVRHKKYIFLRRFKQLSHLVMR